MAPPAVKADLTAEAASLRAALDSTDAALASVRGPKPRGPIGEARDASGRLVNSAVERVRSLVRRAEEGGGVCAPQVVGSLVLTVTGLLVLLVVLFHGGVPWGSGRPIDSTIPAYADAHGVAASLQAELPELPEKEYDLPTEVHPGGGYKCPRMLSLKWCLSTRARHVSARTKVGCRQVQVYCVFNRRTGAFVQRTKCGDLYPAPCSKSDAHSDFGHLKLSPHKGKVVRNYLMKLMRGTSARKKQQKELRQLETHDVTAWMHHTNHKTELTWEDGLPTVKPQPVGQQSRG